MRTILGSWLVGLLVVASVSPIAAQPVATQPIAHRGLLRYAPENTLANFRACQNLRLGFEFDVRRSKDGTLICLHDDSVDRTTNGKGLAIEKTDAELSQLDAGTWFDPAFQNERVPTIEQIFEVIAGYPREDAIFTADLTGADEKLEQDVVELARRHKVLSRILFIGRAINLPEVRARLRKADPGTHVACLAQTEVDLEKAILDYDSDWVYLRFVPTAEMVERAGAAGKRSIVAGAKVSGEEAANWKLCAEAGVNLILTDYPLELRRKLKDLRIAQTK
jgi:glycerophosphoryl diester phosphodiesterase